MSFRLLSFLNSERCSTNYRTKLGGFVIALSASLALFGCGGGGGGAATPEAPAASVAPTVATVGGAPATVVAGGSPLPLVSTVPAGNAVPASATTWTIAPAGLGSLGQTSGAASSYVPPAAGGIAVTTTVVVTATLNGQSTKFDITLYAKTPSLSLLAGDIGGPGSVDGVGSAARFWNPKGVAIDGLGYIYVADTENNAIRKLTPAGEVTTLAGTMGVAGAKDGTGAAATFNKPNGIAVDAGGNLYVADGGTMVRKVTPAGVVTTLAGSSGVAIGSVDGTGAAARFAGLQGLAIDSTGNLYAVDSGNHTIRKITPAGVVTTLAGAAGVVGSADGTGTTARFNYPNGIAVDGNDNLYVADTGNLKVRKISTAGVVTTFAAGLGYPRGVATDSVGYVYVSDGNAILKISGGGVVANLAGSGFFGSIDGVGTVARFDGSTGMAVDLSGNVYVADTANNTIRVVSAVGQVNTLAGAAQTYGSSDGIGAVAKFDYAVGVATDNVGNVFVADVNSATIRKITPAGVVSTYAGSPGMEGSADGAAATARFFRPQGVAVDIVGNVFVADSSNHTIRRISPNGVVSTLAGTAGVIGSSDGLGTAASFSFPSELVTDSVGNVYVIDNLAIRKITPAGLVTTLAGKSGANGAISSDGAGAEARFSAPAGIAIDGAGNVYVADRQRIRKITAAGEVSTLTLSGGTTGVFFNEGPNGILSLGSITVDAANNLYVVDIGRMVYKIKPDGVMTTVVGAVNKYGLALGALPGGLYGAQGIAVFGDTLYISTGSAVVQVSGLP